MITFATLVQGYIHLLLTASLLGTENAVTASQAKP